MATTESRTRRSPDRPAPREAQTPPTPPPVDPPPPQATRARVQRRQAAAVRAHLVPRTAIGLASVLLAAAVGAALSGVCLYAYYEHRLDQNETFTRQFAADFGRTYENATKNIDADGQNARAQIQRELEPLRQLAAGGDVLTSLQKNVGPSVWFIQTQDAQGQPSVGSAFVAASDNNQTLLVTSYTTVAASARAPGPAITATHGGDQVKATLWTWQPERDLALLIIPKPNQPRLVFAPQNPPLAIGQRLFALSGLGGSGTAITQGFVADVSANAIQHDVPIGQAFQGAPLVDDQSHVVGVASRTFAPLGFPSDTVWFGVPGRAVCEKVLKCPNNDPGSATQGAKP